MGPFTMSTSRPDTYFAEKYGLTPPHSEVVAALPKLTPGNALDLGCGRGRNSLFLNQHGFTVTGWDDNPTSLASLNAIIQQEQLQNLHTQRCDLNQVRFNGSYEFVFSTVVMMFLQPQTIPQLIADMQASTRKYGYNLIVSAMDTNDYPNTQNFPFTFKSGELSHYYRNWHIVKYNEEVGELHRRDENGQRMKYRFATLLAQKASYE